MLPKQCHWHTWIFKDHQPTDSSKIYISSPDLFGALELYIKLPLWTPPFGCLPDISNLTDAKEYRTCFSSSFLHLDKWYLYLPRRLSQKYQTLGNHVSGSPTQIDYPLILPPKYILTPVFSISIADPPVRATTSHLGYWKSVHSPPHFWSPYSILSDHLKMQIWCCLTSCLTVFNAFPLGEYWNSLSCSKGLARWFSALVVH